MRISALLDNGVDGSLYSGREGIGISQVFMEILRFRSRSNFWQIGRGVLGIC